MIPEKKAREDILAKPRLKIKRRYKKYFFKTALLLCLYQVKYRILSGAANFIFSGKKQKASGFLKFANKAVNKNICKCQVMAEKCEYYKRRINMIMRV